MKKASIRSIQQKNNTVFTITWTDGQINDYTLSKLQEKCPCAGCQENPPEKHAREVRATKIRNVGRYALQIHFTSGCSVGIYDFDFLRNETHQEDLP